MEDRQTLLIRGLDKTRQLRKKGASYARILVGRELEGEAERLACKKLRRLLLMVLLYGTLSFFYTLTPLFEGAAPLGIALFAATTGSAATASLLGLLIASFLTPYPLFGVLIPLLGGVLRLILCHALPQKGIFREGLALRVAVATVCGFLSGFAYAAMVKFTMESVYALLFMSVMTPLFCRVFAFATDAKSASVFHEPGRLTLLFFLVYALNTHGFFHYSLGLIVAFFVTLSVAITNGALRSALVGLVTGLACGLPFAPILAVAGFTTGLLCNLSLTYSVFASLGISIVMHLYLNADGNILSFSGDLFFSTILFLPLAKVGLIPEICFFAEEPAELPDMKYVEDVRKRFRKNRLFALSQAFEELSDIFLDLSETSRRPGSFELREAGQEVLSRYCKKCSMQKICHKEDYDEIGRAMDKVYEKVGKGEPAQADDLPHGISTRCRQMEKILREINNAAADLVEKAIRRDKTELFALDYEAMAELLNETADEGEDEFEADKPLCKKAADCLKRIGVYALGYSAWGHRRKTILASGVEIASLSVSGKEIRQTLEEATGLILSEPHFDFNGDFVTMRLDSRPKITADVACAGQAKENESVSGDSVSVFDGPCHNRFLLICDGMGSGKNAAVSARISTVFLEKMLSAGNQKSVVFKMLSNFLRSKSEECHSTADLLEIDLLSSRAIFTKCGAAPSFILRAGNLFRLENHTVPIGITREIDTKPTEMALLPGDLIIMMSDGVPSSEDELSLLRDALSDCALLSPKEIADKLLTLSSEQDDGSVLVARIASAQ